MNCFLQIFQLRSYILLYFNKNLENKTSPENKYLIYYIKKILQLNNILCTKWVKISIDPAMYLLPERSV